jgi:hypothetical protein
MLALRSIAGTVGELFHFLRARKRWWLMPMVAVLLLLSLFIILGSVAGVGPFIYTLF